MVPMTNHFSGSMLGSLTARLADIDPDLTQSLSDEERELAQRLSLRVLEVGEEELHLAATLAHERAAGLIVVEGMVRHHLRIGERLAIRLLAAGEILACGDRPGSMLLSLSQWYTSGGTRLAVLGEEFLLAIRRWPRLYTAMQQRMAAQAERLAAQLVICQLPRVEDRLLAILWLLAESWGRVTPAGTTVPLALTHEALGALVGARRSTVTLALGELTSRGAIVHQDRGWLLLERPVELSGEASQIEAPRLLDGGPSEWALVEDAPLGYSAVELLDTVRALQMRHRNAIDEVQERLGRAERSRRASQALRKRIAQQRSATQRLRSVRRPPQQPGPLPRRPP